MNENDLELLLDYWVEGIDDLESSEVQRLIGVNPRMASAFIQLNKTFSPLQHYKENERLAVCPIQGLANKTFQQIYLLEQERKSTVTPCAPSHYAESSVALPHRTRRSQAEQKTMGRAIPAQTGNFLLHPVFLISCLCFGFLLITFPSVLHSLKDIPDGALVGGSQNNRTSNAPISINPTVQTAFTGDVLPNPSGYLLVNSLSEDRPNNYLANNSMGNVPSAPLNASAPSSNYIDNSHPSYIPYSLVDSSSSLQPNKYSQNNSFRPANEEPIDLTSSSMAFSAAPSTRLPMPQCIVCSQGSPLFVLNFLNPMVIDPEVGASSVLNEELIPKFNQTIDEQHNLLFSPEKSDSSSQRSADPDWDAQRAWNEGVPPLN